MTVRRAFGELSKHAEKIKNDEHQTAGEMTVGDAWAQGDLALVLLDAVPGGATVDPCPQLQLAPGTTQGSRHCLESLEGISVYRHADPTPLDGPILDAPPGLRVNHPEHGDVTLRPGVYAVVYQRAFADELRRVQD
jgi:hypothetical protein